MNSNNNYKNFTLINEREYMKVFIADDTEVIRKHLVSMLSEFNEIEIVGEAEDASEAVKSISKLKPDVVILDIRMPGGGGIHALKVIKSKSPAPVVIMLTSYPYPEYRKKCLEDGADYFFDKLNQIEEIPKVLKKLIKNF